MAIELRDIVTLEFQNDIQNSFALATGFGVVFVDREGRHIGKGGNFCKFCNAINNTEEGSRACALSNRQAIGLALHTKEPSIYICHAGLVNIEIPLMCSGEYVGAITAGQVRCNSANAYPKDKVASKNWLHNPEYARYYKEIKVLTKQQIEATTRSLHNISNYIMQTNAYNKAQQELLLSEKRQLALEHQLKLAELDALQKQVTPHFIFNVISMVSRLVTMTEYATANKILDSFARMMRYTLSDIQSHVTFTQELGYIRSYLSIQQIRFGQRIQYEIHCDKALEEMAFPFFFLQPLVENSIEHGLLELENGGTATLVCRRRAGFDEISLCDNGAGIPPKLLSTIQQALSANDKTLVSGHVGLYNSYRRLRHFFGERLRFEIQSTQNVGSCITIQIAHS